MSNARVLFLPARNIQKIAGSSKESKLKVYLEHNNTNTIQSVNLQCFQKNSAVK